MSKYHWVWFCETQTVKSLLLLWNHAAGSKPI